MAINAYITFGFSESDFKRTYVLPLADSLAADSVSTEDRNNFVRDAVIAINDSLAAGTDDGLADFFRDDDFDGEHGRFIRISNAVIQRDTVNIIYPAATGGNNNG